MEKSVCFIGHRKIERTPEIEKKLRKILLKLIKNGTVNFIFGDHSEFNYLCYDIVTELKETYPQIKRIKFRKDYEDTDDYTMQFLITGYEENICPKGVGSSGRASYVERNQAMIRESDVCIFYYDENYLPKRRYYDKYEMYMYQPKSGTALAYKYALKMKKRIFNLK